MHCGTFVEEPIVSAVPTEKAEPSRAKQTVTLKEDMVISYNTTTTPKKALPIWVYILPIAVFILAFLLTFVFLRSDISLFGGKGTTLGESRLLIVRCGDDLYYIDGEETVQLSENADGIESLFACVEQIADGTFFVVDNLRASDSPYEELTREGGKYIVGDLIMTTPDGEQTKIDENVYETVYSLYDDVCYYQVIEEDRQKICVVIDGETHDLTGWVDGNIDYDSGTPDGARTYFTIVDEDEMIVCVGEDGDYETVMQSDDFLYWLVSDSEEFNYIVKYSDDIFTFYAVEDDNVINTLPKAVDYDYNSENGTLVIQTTDGDVLVYRDNGYPIELESGLDKDDQLALVSAQGFRTDWVLYSKGNRLYIADVSQDRIDPLRIGSMDDWRYRVDPDTNYIYIKGDTDTLLTYHLGAEAADEVVFMDDIVEWNYIDGFPGGFYYITGDEDSYDYTEDKTDLYYYNGEKHILLQENAEWFVSHVVMAFDAEKVFWQANNHLYMADTDGDNTERVLRDAWWVTLAGDKVYGITYDGEVYLIDSDGDKTEIIDDVDDFLTYWPEW
ncbi:MAG: hypothetical protein AB1Z19_04235 [Eubacteriales bacterium]